MADESPDKETSAGDGETPKRAKPGRKPVRAAEMALRNTAIIAAMHAGEDKRDVARRFGMTPRSIERVMATFRLRPTAMDKRPMEIIERVLRTYEQQMADFAALAADTWERAPAVAVAAMKGHAEALERYTLLLGDIGKLPDNLELFRSESEMLQVGRLMGEALEKVANGEMAGIEAKALLWELLHRPSALLWEAPEGSVRELERGEEAA